jgi:hypothetical protein
MTNIFLEISWSGPLLWAILYISDNTLTMLCARMYKAQNIIKFEGSFELTPAFQKDVDALRRLSPKFLTILTASIVLLFLSWLLGVKFNGGKEIYLITLGVLIMAQLAVHMRHMHNWFFYRYCIGQGGIQGQIEYPRKVTLRISSFELFSFALLFLIIFFLTFNWILLGGAAGCASIALRHHKMSQKHVRQASTA